MKIESQSRSLASMLSVLALCGACGPLGGSSEPLPYLELSAASVTFDAGEDSHLVELRNTGGGVIPFDVLISAESGGVTWLQAEPTGGTLEGGTTRAVLLTITNREALLPGTYSGQVSIEAENVEGRSLLVSMTVGQPILDTDPAEDIDYGASTAKRTLLVTNAGDGSLLYSVLLPGPWITTTAPLQKTLAAGQSDTLVLDVDRSAVPWYGAGEDELLVTSNGLNDATHHPTAKLTVRVTTDANCGSDADCGLPGYFCDDSDGDGACALRKDNGSACQTDKQCASAVCVEGVCCNAPCGGDCLSCALAATKGTCSPVPDGSDCDDGLVCTEDDGCSEGTCLGGPPMDCADQDNPCGDGVCSESAGGCAAPALDDHCVIEETCLDDGDWHPDIPCLRCLPGTSATAWSIIPDRCLVGEVCYKAGDEIGGPCTLCDPATPESTTAAADQQTCDDDGNPCTADHCLSGVCEHPGLDGEACEDSDPCTHTDLCDSGGACAGTAYPCDDGLDCTADICNGDGTCSVEIEVGSCVIEGTCVADGAALAGAGGCSACDALLAPEQWTAQADAFPCDDGDACTEDDSCLDGLCLGLVKNCDDGAECTADVCVAGDCAHEIDADTCLIGGGCFAGGAVSADSPCQACQPDLAVDAWTPYNVGTPCDLPNATAQCGEAGDCVLIECVDALHGDCNETSSDGCEVELWQDLMHCGACDDPCTMPNAWTSCAGGQCTFVACHEGFTNCDGELDTGCEAATATDPTNCGKCGLECTSSNPAKVGTCDEGDCVLSACPQNQWNLDGNPSNGCECTVGGPELCNGVDDDCDGQTDEGFDFMTDLENCGGCEAVCDLPDAAGFTCTNGACLLTACSEGWYDRNGEPADGCEHELFFVGELWVDGFGGGGPDEDGSKDHPFDSIQEAVDVAFPSYLIHVAEGGYVGGVTVDKVGLSIVGAGADAVTLANPEYGTGILVTADDVSIAGLKLSGGAVGVHFHGDPLLKLQGGLVAEVVAEQLIGEDETGQGAAGVLAEYSDDVTVSFTTVTTVQGGSNSTQGPGGGHASGVRLVGSDDPRLMGNQFADLTGGGGGGYYSNMVRSSIAAGFHLVNSTGALVRGNTVTDATGGQGIGVPASSASATGGVGAGIYLEESQGTLVDGNSLSAFLGGLPGCGVGPWVASQNGYGIYMDEGSSMTTVEQTNTMDGDLIVYLFGVEDVVIKNLSLVAESNPTNHGKLVVIESSGITITGNEIAHFHGPTGQTSSSCAKPEAGHPGRGIYLDKCTGCTVTDNIISDISGGRGGARLHNNCLGGDGGDGAAVELSECLDTVVHGNTAWAIFSGGKGNPMGFYAESGVVAAYLIRESQGIEFSNNLARYLRLTYLSSIGEFKLATCVFVDATDTLMIDHLACHDVGDEITKGYGVTLGDAQLSQVHMRNSIVSEVTGYGVKGLAGVPGMAMAWFSAFHECGLGLVEDATLSSCIEADPLFVLPDEGNLHLQSGSPAIDAGNPATECTLEPVPNGCAVNMGAYGGTAEATSAPGVEHCSPCP